MHLPASLAVSSLGGLYRLRANETMAAISKMISVMSCRASHTNWRKVLGGFGGIMLDPNTSRRPSKSALSPRRPENGQIIRVGFRQGVISLRTNWKYFPTIEISDEQNFKFDVFS